MTTQPLSTRTGSISPSDVRPQTSDWPQWLTEPTQPIDAAARNAATARQQQLTKPPGSLGRLEDIVIDLAGMQGTASPALKTIAVRVFAGDHGIVREGVSAFPQAVTVEMIRNFARGGAAIAVLSRQLGADFSVINLGTAQALTDSERDMGNLLDLQLAPGTANICTEAAMSDTQLAGALQAGYEAVATAPCQLFVGGEMGIGNTATTAALTSALLDLPSGITVGRGTGVDDRGLGRKRSAVERALFIHKSHCTSPLETLRRLGGLEIAALTGAYIAAAQRGIPSLVDGYICTAAAYTACAINPGVRDWLLFAHRSAEPGHHSLLEALNAVPLLDLGMRLGEGSGAAVAVNLLQSACLLHNQMATFDEAGVSTGDD